VEVISYNFMLPFPEEEKPGVFFVNTSHHPLLLTNVVMDLMRFIPDASNHHQCCHQVFCENILIFITFE
jgi:hypothetical protein